MRPILLAAALLMATTAAAPVIVPSPAIAAPSQKGAVTIPALRKIVESLGHETRNLDGEAADAGFEFTVVEDGLDIHILAELSESTNYIWLKVALSGPPAGVDGYDFLRQTAEIQPAHFYLYSDGQLGMAVAVDNRLVNADAVERGIGILVNGVVTTKELWLVDDQPDNAAH